jgi:enoyl-CoA hydratase/carnithine racemase
VGLLTVTLNRPERLNAIDTRVHADLQALCRELQTDYETRVVIFTGAGRAFSAGADIGSSRGTRGSTATSTMRAQQNAGDVLQERMIAGTGSRTAEL